jgi:hypothetical protein
VLKFPYILHDRSGSSRVNNLVLGLSLFYAAIEVVAEVLG